MGWRAGPETAAEVPGKGLGAVSMSTVCLAAAVERGVFALTLRYSHKTSVGRSREVGTAAVIRGMRWIVRTLRGRAYRCRK
jgi:hypothetical protein